MILASGSYIGKGAYSIADAARIVHAPYTTVRGWLNPEHGIIPRRFGREIVSFVELMEIHFIKMFMDEGVHPRTIHAAAQTAANLFKTDYPFAVKRFDTDGRDIFATLARQDGGAEMIEDLKRGQFVFKTIMRPFFKKLDYNRSEIARYWPMGKRGRVTLDPDRQFGQPIDHESGIPTKALYQATRAGKGQSFQQVALWFDIPEAAVRAAVGFEKSLA
ncbi:MAG: hypothetical protein WD847_02030 [Pirellulales bacterium]